MIKLVNGEVGYKDKLLFKDANFLIDKPGIYLLKGDNGSGKSSLLNVIAKIIKVKGKMENDYLAKMSLVFQNNELIDTLKIKELLDLFDIDIKILNKYKLMSKLENYPSTLSTGERQKIAFIIAIYSDAKLVLLDEMSANLDQKSERLIKKEIIKFSKEKIIILVSHNSQFSKKEISGKLTIKDNKLEFVLLNEKKETLGLIDKRKRKLTSKFKIKKKSYKFMVIYSLLVLILFSFHLGVNLLNKMVDEDIVNSVDYNKAYLRKCSLVSDKIMEINKCSNPSEEELIDKGIEYRFNYDLVLASLYSDERLKVMDNEMIKLKEGRYPLSFNEVIANSDYRMGETIKLKANILVSDKKIDYYLKDVELVVVGIYQDLHFFSEDSLFFDYKLVDEYYKQEILINNKISLFTYYDKLAIDNYKYLSFKVIDDPLFNGEKIEYYQAIKEIVSKVETIVYYLQILVYFFGLFNLFRIFRLELVNNQRNFAFLLANSFSKINLLYLLLKQEILFVSITSFTLVLIAYLVTKVFAKEIIFLLVATLVILVSLALVFTSRVRVAKLLREEAW